MNYLDIHSLALCQQSANRHSLDCNDSCMHTTRYGLQPSATAHQFSAPEHDMYNLESTGLHWDLIDIGKPIAHGPHSMLQHS